MTNALYWTSVPLYWPTVIAAIGFMSVGISWLWVDWIDRKEAERDA